MYILVSTTAVVAFNKNSQMTLMSYLTLSVSLELRIKLIKIEYVLPFLLLGFGVYVLCKGS